MRIWLSTIGLVTVFAVGLAYLLLGVVRIDPTAEVMTMRVNLAQSGGLLGRSDVTFRGYRVGNVKQIQLVPGGVAVDIEVDSGAKIPADTEAVVASLSAAGEQYLDFRPRTDAGPFLANGAVIEEKNTSTPTPFAQLLGHVNGLAGQVDPRKLTLVIDELAKAFDGTGPDLKKLLDGGDFLLAGLEGVLPETVSILNNSSVVLDTANGLTDELSRLGTAGVRLGDQLRKSDPEIRTLLDHSPAAFDLVDGLIKENKPTMAALLGDLSTVSEVVSMRLPAISAFLPELANGGNALAAIVRGGAIQTLVDAYPRAGCDYHTPRRPPTIGGSPPPPLDVHCTDTRVTVQQRGSQNAPRPGGPVPMPVPVPAAAPEVPTWFTRYPQLLGQ
ncbi:MCE family protein [Amycolatopsis sp. cg5]|uniref:MCE family protein n=1 Tax=Amycolatopsis sp. cg5 TaxID=3238802 RepID=UPI003523AD6C